MLSLFEVLADVGALHASIPAPWVLDCTITLLDSLALQPRDHSIPSPLAEPAFQACVAQWVSFVALHTLGYFESKARASPAVDWLLDATGGRLGVGVLRLGATCARQMPELLVAAQCRWIDALQDFAVAQALRTSGQAAARAGLDFLESYVGLCAPPPPSSGPTCEAQLQVRAHLQATWLAADSARGGQLAQALMRALCGAMPHWMLNDLVECLWALWSQCGHAAWSTWSTIISATHIAKLSTSISRTRRMIAWLLMFV
jgi:hypothetical protein